jgi:hypothetical protein
MRLLFVYIVSACLMSACGGGGGGGGAQTGGAPPQTGGTPPDPGGTPPPVVDATPPRADPGPSRILDLGRQATLDGSASTAAAGRTITYRWALGATPAGSAAVLADANSARPSFVPDVEGDYQVTLVVNDGIADSQQAGVALRALWRPDDAGMPATGNLVYLESANGDPVGNGASFTFTPASTVLSVSVQGAQLNVTAQGAETWFGSLAPPAVPGRFVPGYYGPMTSDTWLGNGGVSWWGSSGICENGASTWLLIDSATYDGDTLTAVDLRFSQRCQDSPAPLHGRLRWSIGDNTQPPGPVATPPAGLWQAPAGTTPASGNYVYLDSAPGDSIGQGQRHTFTDATGAITVSAVGSIIIVDVQADTWWLGNFVGMSSLGRVTPGYYDNLQDYPSNNPARGGLDWSGDGRACTTSTGWFAVDNANYLDNVLVALDLRFGQQCDNSPAVLNGQIHWLAPGQ